MKTLISVIIALVVAICYCTEAQKDACGSSICLRGNTACFTFGASTDKFNWYAASELCRSKGMYLATLETQQEIDTISKYIQQCVGPAGNTFWIGGSDKAQEGFFTWEYTGQDIGLTNWAPGDPNNYLGREHCIEVQPYVYGRYGLWYDNDCDNVNTSYICKVNPACK